MTAKAYLKIIRPSVCLLTVFALIVGGIVSGQIPIMQILSGTAIWSPLIIIFAIIAAFLLCGAGNTINDYFDVEIDKINAPHRPIPSGQMGRKRALYYYIGLSVIGIVLAALVSFWYLTIVVINFAVLSMYGWKWKRTFVIKNIAVAWLAACSFLAGGLITGISLNGLLITITLISFLGAWSREIFKDIEDKDGDSRQGIRTIGTRFSEGNARIIGLTILIFAIVSLTIPIFMNTISADAGGYYIVFSVLIMATCFAGISRKSPRNAQKSIKIAMYLVILMFLVVALLA
ncbi:MAG: geranylgeranylglycerol-phosphate geranylgeranyltransferase [Candidatus Aenigmatarchaeota archaeon]